MDCPRDGNKLKKIGISMVCPQCSYKVFQPDKKVYPELNHVLSFPTQFSWDSFTLSSITVSDGSVALTEGATSGTLESPELINIGRHVDRKLEVTKVLIRSLLGSKEDGKVKIEASNDGGTTYITIKDDGQEWNLNYGNEAAGGTFEQQYYYDLRFKITLSRSSASDTSPYITSMVVEHNVIPEIKKIKKRENLTELMIGG